MKRCRLPFVTARPVMLFHCVLRQYRARDNFCFAGEKSVTHSPSTRELLEALQMIGVQLPVQSAAAHSQFLCRVRAAPV